MNHICESCGKEFKTKKSVSRFCSRPCLYKSMDKKKSFTCKVCGKEFKATQTRKNVQFCSIKCSNKGKIGVKHTDEHISKIRESSKLTQNSGWFEKGQNVGKNSSSWKGGRRKYRYIYIWKPEHPFSTKQGCVCEHRLIVEQHLGRYLLKNELVHHINEDRYDNRLENLYLYSNKSDHTRAHLLNELPIESNLV